MAESTLTTTHTILAAAVGKLFGYSDTAANWSAAEIAEINLVVQRGLLRFLYPPSGYQWTFLAPRNTFVTVADTLDYDLPDDFGGIYSHGMLTVFDPDGVYFRIDERGEEHVRHLRALSSTSGRPQLYAIRVKAQESTTTQSTRYEMLLWPDPDLAYTIEYRYQVLQDMLLTGNYAIGGMPHRLALLDACLAECESDKQEPEGIHEARFARSLASSIAYDIGMRPMELGRSYDHSDDLPGRVYHEDSSYNGSVPTG